TQHLDIGCQQKQWLMSEAFCQQSSFEIIALKYAWNIKDKKAFL
ncbi:hypothetical protein DBR06_SOUSAS8510042, partial [Sousa chinensis]